MFIRGTTFITNFTDKILQLTLFETLSTSEKSWKSDWFENALNGLVVPANFIVRMQKKVYLIGSWQQSTRKRKTRADTVSSKFMRVENQR